MLDTWLQPRFKDGLRTSLVWLSGHSAIILFFNEFSPRIWRGEILKRKLVIKLLVQTD
jgi:hypothetical protein